MDKSLAENKIEILLKKIGAGISSSEIMSYEKDNIFKKYDEILGQIKVYVPDINWHHIRVGLNKNPNVIEFHSDKTRELSLKNAIILLMQIGYRINSSAEVKMNGDTIKEKDKIREFAFKCVKVLFDMKDNIPFFDEYLNSKYMPSGFAEFYKDLIKK